MLLVTGCEMFPPDDSQTQPVTVEAPAISGVSADDTSMTATITPVAGTGFYSYAVIQGPRQTLDPSTLLGVGYGDAIISGTVNYAEKESETISTDGLSRNVWYYIYAVAASEQGVPSEVAVDSVYTSNSLTPDITGNMAADTARVIIGVEFSENISLGNGNVYAIYTRKNDPNYKLQITLPKDSLATAENLLMAAVPDKTPGQYVTLRWDAGAVVNSAGTTCPEWNAEREVSEEISFTIQAGRKVWNLGYELVLDADGDTTYFAGDETFLFSDWTTFTAVFTPEKEIAVALAAIRVTYTSTNGDVFSYDNENFNLNADGNLVVALDRAPSYGDVVTFSFPAGMFQDVYGNPSAAFTTEPIYNYAFDYEVEDIEGAYTAALGSGYTGNWTTNANVVITGIEENAIEELNGFVANVTIENLYREGTRLYGYFDTVAGTVTVPSNQYLCHVGIQGEEEPQELIFQNYADSEEPILFNVPEAGYLYSESQWWLFLPDLNSFLDIFVVTELVRDSSSASGIASTSVPSLSTLKAAPKAGFNHIQVK